MLIANIATFPVGCGGVALLWQMLIVFIIYVEPEISIREAIYKEESSFVTFATTT